VEVFVLFKRALPLALLLAAALAALLILGGCGGTTRDQQQALADAVEAARDAGSAHAQMNVSLSPMEGEGGMGLNVQGDAWLDMNSKMLEARFTVMGLELSLRYVDGSAYIQFGGTWYELTGEVLNGVGPGTMDSLVEVLTSVPDIFSSNIDVTELGEKNVGGYECDNLEVKPDLEAIASMDSVRKLAEDLGMTTDEIVGYLQDADLVMEVCVQRDEPVIREVFLAANVDLPDVSDLVGGIALLPQRAHVEITMDFPEYGVEVNVQAPADAKPFKGLL
jgi:hypothetical protein